ncbi:MAG: amino acid-binding protein [Lachnospiraceae bacterium]|nr:amino acid-binding protein [Lachnospiraceae bacterium]MCR4991831.1 amino acid-binding protein [Lachnospiraceae bacterium]
MILKQLSVFVENKEGRMKDITQVLKDSGINIKTLSLADTTEYGMLRLIVSDPDLAKAKLREAGFPVSITDVLAVKADDRIGFLHDMLLKLDANITSIEYMYTLPTEEGPVVILKVANPAEVEKVLENI